MRLIIVAIICALGLTACAPPNNEAGSTTTDLVLEGDVTSSPDPAVVGTSEQISFNVANVTTTGATYTNVPFSVSLYNPNTQQTTSDYYFGTIPTIAPGTTAVGTFSDTQTLPGTFIYTITLDPNNTTNAVQSPGSAVYSLPWQATASG